jgi:hypothetical protein
VGLLPFAYTVRKDKREREERVRADAKKEEAEKERGLEEQRARMRATAMRYGDLLGKAMALLEAILVDADNADQLIWSATDAQSELEGHAQGFLRTEFKESPPVIWADRACRKVLRDGLNIASDARAERQTGAAAQATQRTLQRLTMVDIDTAGPRDLFRWSSDEACKRWPKPLTSFKDETWAEVDAKRLQEVLDFEPPP